MLHSVSKGDVASISLCNCCVPKGDDTGVVSISCEVMSGEFVVLDGPNFFSLALQLLAHEARGEVGEWVSRTVMHASGLWATHKLSMCS